MKKYQSIRGFVVGVIITLLVCAMIIPAPAEAVTKQLNATYLGQKIIIDGIEITPKDAAGNVVEPFFVDGTTYLPVRAVAEALGKPVDYDASSFTVYIGKRPGAVQYMADVVPAYNSAKYREYSSLKSGGKDSFYMSGTKYADGLSFDCYGEANAVFNLNGQYNSLTGLLGHVDGTANYNSTLRVYKDGVLSDEIGLSFENIAIPISIDLKGVLQLKIAFDSAHGGYGSAHYAIANPIIE